MPKKDGIEVAKEILARLPGQRIIIARAYAKEIFSRLPDELKHSLEFLQKPVELDELIAAIDGNGKRKLP